MFFIAVFVKNRLTAVLQDAMRQVGLEAVIKDMAAEPDRASPTPAASDDAFGARLMAAIREQAEQLHP